MRLHDYWYQKKIAPLLWPLLPLSCAFGILTSLRRHLYRLGLKKTQQTSLPVIIVGNLTVGGTGKTPFVLWLADFLKAQGKNPGIALRGVGGKKHYEPYVVTADSDPFEAGDEAVLLAQQSACPVVACCDRVKAVKKLSESCDLILCDDGLQHYRLARDLEIAMVDSNRYFGNGLLLPAGPLREPLSRLAKVDFIIINESAGTVIPFKKQLPLALQARSFKMTVKAVSFVSVHDKTKVLALEALAGQKVHAVAGIGNPQRFFELLRSLKLELIPHIFPDHYAYQKDDFHFGDKLPIIMTEKDAIKCHALSKNGKMQQQHWFLRVETELSAAFQAALLAKISGEKYETATHALADR